MKRTWIGALLALTACGTVTEEPQVFDILAFGAVGDGVTECTAAVQAAIDSLHLDKGAVLRGVDDPEAYASFIPQHDLSMYDSGGNSANANNTGDRRWMKAFLQGNGIEGASITGEGLIDGRHVFDSLGEENMRGPHTIIVGEAKDFRIEGVSITRAANYAFLGYALENAVFKGMHITEGWDGIHIRGGKHVEIADCLFETGDDAIAGGYWEGMLIRDCEINSSCNGVRMIMPSDGPAARPGATTCSSASAWSPAPGGKRPARPKASTCTTCGSKTSLRRFPPASGRARSPRTSPWRTSPPRV